MINVLVADDELPAVEELAFLLRKDDRIGMIHRASSGAEVLRALEVEEVDAVFLDIHMPALSGLDIARVISRSAHPPAVVFVTADEERALEAFELAAVDYLLKPVRAERLAKSVGRISERTKTCPASDSSAASRASADGRTAGSGPLGATPRGAVTRTRVMPAAESGSTPASPVPTAGAAG